MFEDHRLVFKVRVPDGCSPLSPFAQQLAGTVLLWQASRFSPQNYKDAQENVSMLSHPQEEAQLI